MDPQDQSDHTEAATLLNLRETIAFLKDRVPRPLLRKGNGGSIFGKEVTRA